MLQYTQFSPKLQRNSGEKSQREKISDSGFLDYADNQGNEIDHEAVQDRDQAHFETAADDAHGNIPEHLDGVKAMCQKIGTQ